MKLMLDIHGVLDKNPRVFVPLACEILCQPDNEVHIVTGHTVSSELIEQLLSYNHGMKYWTHLVSIQDELSKDPSLVIGVNAFDRPVFDDRTWDSFKGKYAWEHDIDLAIDDTERYREYFVNTAFLLYK